MCREDSKEIAIVSAGLYSDTGGPSIVIADLIESLFNLGYEINVFTPNGKIHSNIIAQSEKGRARFHYFKGYFRYKFNISAIRKAYEIIGRSNIVWIHGLFQWPTLLCFVIAILRRKEIIVTPHGVLTKGMLRQKWLKKKVFGFFDIILIKSYQKVSIHFLSEKEEKESIPLLSRSFIMPNIVRFSLRKNYFNSKICFRISHL